jgi:hypothetical protein
MQHWLVGWLAETCHMLKLPIAAGGLVDVITQPGTTGLLYPPGDYNKAAELTAQLAASPDMRQRIGDAARKEVRLLFQKTQAYPSTALVGRLVLCKRPRVSGPPLATAYVFQC